MKCQVINSFKNRGEIILPGNIIDVPEEMLQKMAGYVQTLTHCQAPKVGGRICGAPLKEHKGFYSCSDKFCQVPVKAVQK